MSKQEIIIDGMNIHTEADFHRILSGVLNFGPYYGNNLNALWDRLSNDVERPITLIWINAELSQKQLGNNYREIIHILERVKKQDIDFNFEEKFDFILK